MSARPVSVEDLRYMDVALALAYARLGATAPNPSVGCVIVKQGRIIGAAATAPGGRPHAEPQALAQAGDAAQDASVYVTLEPCAHYGQTPPCAEALIKARPAEVIIACRDPFEHVAGRGVAMLEDAGIDVLEGVREAQALAMNAGFFHRLKTGRPLLARDLRPALFDADLSLEPGESVDMALDRFGKAGLTRIRQV
ncbi:MAG: riboflavin biosynthesis protein RibD [Oceanicaulis sp.]|uniref:bifunctional diaminohydroxyphosphoribosylaminopyrimidine deaminase/5-amino-6-(5-phosphoribosylamino)uracil reductase RibD n=1 Tax=Oceanicaulis sp. UBA2681 TaxID=1947007 RepID=UPI000C0A4ADA|nr:bifunctional diaminohydroxyphosphoribosylaminopyrimidine deaminase/5-amino-6-(5-phosphoribosylamino)uracil reductase RibD [Oceanicaulis sp. UBA2681]MAP48730.1 riboflavin biosynthesis protein RibD [Oceanicaulis sp.]HCR66865.1 bifunctional diaminohydroxyphosphoribosylaminopyrimidine deaminase/5-amino-6-(5-phosphoribosylamino)uracil reductase RibD [Oceanicaulis sp.]|tara:strand:+ start:175 stop:762 length:588 start_codon:yes stop_codon:yes gene_type:complete